MKEKLLNSSLSPPQNKSFWIIIPLLFICLNGQVEQSNNKTSYTFGLTKAFSENVLLEKETSMGFCYKGNMLLVSLNETMLTTFNLFNLKITNS